MRVTPVGDTALTFTLAPPDAARLAVALADGLRHAPLAGVTDVVPAFDSVTVFYDPAAFEAPVAAIEAWARRQANKLGAPVGADAETPVNGRDRPIIEIPVHYGGDDTGPDLVPLARALRLSPVEWIHRHAVATYTVAAIGFLPGFVYLAGLDASLHAARRDTPRTRVPAGSVAVGGPYAGVYPVASPGGWHVIGRTTMKLFDPARPAAVPWRMGDRVKFVVER